MQEGKKIRVFIAVPLPDPVKSDLTDLQMRLKKSGLHASYPKPKTFHLTLKFIGDVDIQKIDTIVRCMKEAVGQVKAPIRLKAAALGVFPSVKKGRVLWSGISGGTTDILALVVKSINNGLYQHLGIQPETRRFSPHLTLARLKKKVKPEKLVSLIRQYSQFCTQEFEVHVIRLYKSELNASGAVHTVLAEIKIPV